MDYHTLIKRKTYPNLWLRSSVIPNKIVNTIVCVHNGKEFKRVIITKEKIGFKLGEFSFTRKLQLKSLKAKKSLPKKK